MTERELALLAINGSERPGGNTDQVLGFARRVAEGLGVEFVEERLRDRDIVPCGACGECNMRALPCAVPDDVGAIVAAMSRADGVIYAAPVHGFGMAELMQRFIERAGVGLMRFNRPLTNKVGGAIVTGRRYSHEQVHAQILANLMLNRMIVPGSGYPAVVHGGAPGSAMRDREGLDSVARTVERMVALMRHLRTAGPGALDVDEVNERAARPADLVHHDGR